MRFDPKEVCLCGHSRNNHASELENTPPSTDIRTGRTRYLVQDGLGPCRWKPAQNEVGDPCDCGGFVGKMNGHDVSPDLTGSEPED